MPLTKKNKARILVYSLIAVGLLIYLYKNSPVRSYIDSKSHRYSTASRLEELEPKIDAQLKPAFEAAQIPYPPATATLLFIKDERVLQLYAGPDAQNQKLIKTYPVKAASGHQGPKLQEGDNQVPEGVYKIESLNPNSLFHLALRVNYPNDDDRRHAESDSRDKLGSDIMIHGSSASVGCIAIGDEAIEEVFILAAKTGYSKWDLILSPTDFRKHLAKPEGPQWIGELYSKITERLEKLPSSADDFLNDVKYEGKIIRVDEIINNLAAYDTKHVLVMGCATTGFEDQAIYAKTSDCVKSNYDHGLWLNFPVRSEIPLSYPQSKIYRVLIEGTVDSNQHGHMGLWAGDLNIIRLLKVKEY